MERKKQDKYLYDMIQRRMQTCKLTLHPEKTQIINLYGHSTKRYPKSFNFLGFTIRPKSYRSFRNSEKICVLPVITVSQKSKTGIMEKFRTLHIHKWRSLTLEQISQRLNPVIGGIINYYHHFQRYEMYPVWYQLNVRLCKWVKWEKGMNYTQARKYLRAKYKENPTLFDHWQVVYP
jgi:hypothetical protein